MNYEDRIVAFIDILGFRSMIGETINKDGRDETQKIGDIYDAYKTIEQIWSDKDILDKSKQVTIFSDSIVVSVRAKHESEIFWTLLEIKHLIMALIWRGILVRGSVVRGKLIHEPEKVFGPALVEAYVLESKAALYPRIILDRDIVLSAGEAKAQQHSSKQEMKYVESLLEKDSDGMYYVDYFFKAQEELDDPSYDFPAYITALAEIIRKGLMGSVHPNNADIRVKYSWMRERYNQMVDKVKSGLPSISEFDVDNVEDDLTIFYRSLKKISPNRR